MLRRIPRVAAIAVLLASTVLCAQTKPTKAVATTPDADISGMYTFLQDGEFVQITVERPEPQNVGLPGQTAPPVTSRPGYDPMTEGTAAASTDRMTMTKVPIDMPTRVTGFISRFGDLESDKGTFLDHFFSKGSLAGDALSFTTKPLHGVWFEFKGRVERGTTKTRAEEGYYVVRGTLKRFSTDVNKKTTSQSRELVMKSFPDLDTQEQKK